jgi:serine/threonine protein kinase
MAPEMFEGGSEGGNDHRLCDIWATGVCIYCMTECKVRQKRHVLRHLYIKMHHFTKTGAGQT